MSLFYYPWQIVSTTMLYIIFQYNWEPVLIQRTLIGFDATLENNIFYFSNKMKKRLKNVQKPIGMFLLPIFCLDFNCLWQLVDSKNLPPGVLELTLWSVYKTAEKIFEQNSITNSSYYFFFSCDACFIITYSTTNGWVKYISWWNIAG